MTARQDIRIALIGCGYWRRKIGRCLHEAGALAAVSDSEPVVAEAAGDAFGVPVVTLADLLDNVRIDAVAVTKPVVRHYGLARNRRPRIEAQEAPRALRGLARTPSDLMAEAA